MSHSAFMKCLCSQQVSSDHCFFFFFLLKDVWEQESSTAFLVLISLSGEENKVCIYSGIAAGSRRVNSVSGVQNTMGDKRLYPATQESRQTIEIARLV